MEQNTNNVSVGEYQLDPVVASTIVKRQIVGSEIMSGVVMNSVIDPLGVFFINDIPKRTSKMEEEWIQFLIAYYKKAIYGKAYREIDYRRWAITTLDEELRGLGDYFSRSQYVPETL